MPLVYSWFFWITIIGILMALIGGILIFATDLGYIAWIVTGVGILLLILGIIFWIRDARKPKKKQSLIDKVKSKTPGLYEFSRFEEVTGLGDTRRRVQEYGMDATKSVGRGVKRGAVKTGQYVTSDKFKRNAKIASVNAFGAGASVLLPGIGGWYGTLIAGGGTYKARKDYNKTIAAKNLAAQQDRAMEVAQAQQMAALAQQQAYQQPYQQYQNQRVYQQQFVPQYQQPYQYNPQYQNQQPYQNQFIPQQYTQQPQYIQY